MMDMVWIQQSSPFNKYSFNFKDLIRLNTIREPLLIYAVVVAALTISF